jgi:hypothetical protein
MAGKPRVLSTEDAQFIDDVPHYLREVYICRKPCDEIAADFHVSVETARGWFYKKQAFPIYRKVEFGRILLASFDLRGKQLDAIRKILIEEWLSID